MKMSDYLNAALVIGTGPASVCPASRGLQQLGLSLDPGAAWIDAHNDGQARHLLAHAADRAERDATPGLLLLCADVCAEAAFGHADDALIERLENSSWELLYLAHDEAACWPGRAPHQPRPSWLHCDTPPAGVRALGLGLPLLRRLLAQDLGLGSDTGLRAEHWLGLLAWQASRLCGPNAALAQWPAWASAAAIQRARQEQQRQRASKAEAHGRASLAATGAAGAA
ncbi:hypothetical protein WG899_15530 [Paucibacter sp. AS339]|uniref:hypothetical protein n=1 Tax=Paucibacter hankyongi TaxID=3133434 RepID=UPI0030AA44FC